MSDLLTIGVLETIMNGGTVPDAVVQILGSKKMLPSNENERYRLLLSDGKFKINVAMYTVSSHLVDPRALELHSILRLKRYMSNVIKSKDQQDTRILLILELELVAKGATVGHMIGDPVILSDEIINSQRSDLSACTGKVIMLYHTRPDESARSLHECKIITPISSLNPFHNNWVIKARVFNKSAIRHWSNSKGDGKLFSVELVDKGSEIRCTAFKELVDQFYDVLEVGNIYYVARCVLKPINRQFCSLKHEFEMTMTPQTIIEETVEDDGTIPQVTYNYTTIDKIVSMVAGTVVDVIAVCMTISDLQTFTAKSTNRELKKKELLLVDQSKSGIVLTLWNTAAESFNCGEHCTISIKNAKVQEFQGNRTLSTTAGSQIKVNPDDPEALKLKRWFEYEGYQLDFQNISPNSGLVGPIPWMTFKKAQSRILEDDQNFVFQTLATILLIRSDRVVYKSCPSGECQKKVVDLENGMYRCEKCNREYGEFKYRFLLSINASDASSSQWLSVFSREAEKIIGKTASEIGDDLERDPDKVSGIFEDLQFQQYLLKCRAKIHNFNDEQKANIFVIGVENINYEPHNAFLIEKMNQLC